MLHAVHGRRRAKATPEQVIAGLFVVSLLLLTIGAAVGLRHEALLRHVDPVEGRLVAGEEQPARDGDPAQVNDDRLDPADATLGTPEELRAQYLLLIGLGAAFLVAAAVVFGLGMRQAADEPGVPGVARA